MMRGNQSISFESHSGTNGREISVPIATQEFDYSALDSDEDLIKECVLLGENLSEILNAIIEREVSAARAEAVSGALLMIMESKRPVQQTHVLAWAAGIYLSQGISMPELAAKLCVKKQAFQQAVRRVSEKLCLRQTRASRSSEARENMRLSYHENNHH